ncbi:MAG: DUF1553 domain-containing protein, partial [Pirellulaceae bacterium]|nr:DUF1553 domain-containing protein [Pirellulaceae bacterium]
IRAFNDNLPFDRFLTMQLAGDELVDWRNATQYTDHIKDHLIATSFLRHNQDVTDHDQYGHKERFDVLFMTMQTFSSSVMGLTVGCAQCHDHKYEPMPQRDYYRLMGHFMAAYNPDDWVKPKDRYQTNVAGSEKAAIDQGNARLNNQITQVSADIEKLKATPEGDSQAAESQAQIEALQHQIVEMKSRLQKYDSFPSLWDVGDVPRMFLLRRGNHDQPGAHLFPGFPAVLTDAVDGLVHAQRPVETVGKTTGMRLALAHWLTQPETRSAGLVSRVAVNYVWRQHFGRGIVATPGNLGRSGAAPSHPELLDWLAADFIEHGWDRKRLHRQIMSSSTYRQRSARSPQGTPLIGQTLDPDNQLFWRQNVRRLEAEAVRDSVLAVSGRLDRTSYGKAIMLESQPDGMSRVKQIPGKTQHFRRSIYIFVRRNYPLKILETFDTPIVPLNCTARENSASVLQSLTLLNDPFILEHAKVTSQQIYHSVDQQNLPQLITETFLRLVARYPNDSELQRCTSYLQTQFELYRETEDPHTCWHRAHVDLCQMLMCTNEFLYLN